MESIQCTHCLRTFQTRRGFEGHCKKCRKMTLMFNWPGKPGTYFKVLPGKKAMEVWREVSAAWDAIKPPVAKAARGKRGAK